MDNKRVCGLILTILGVLAISPEITGMTIGTGEVGFGYIIGLLFIISGIVLQMDLEEEVESPSSASQAKKMKERLSFWQSHGVPPEHPGAWIVRYHAFPKSSHPDFGRGLETEKVKSAGFYFTETPEEAKQVVEKMGGYGPGELEVAKVMISKNVYREGPKQGRDFIKESYGDFSFPYEYIPKKKFKVANRLIRKGLIKINA